MPRFPFCCFVFTLFLGAALSASASDWPTYGHDNSRLGATSESLPAPLRQAWSFVSPVPPKRAFSGPHDRIYEGQLPLRSRIRFDDAFQVAIAGGRVFFGSSVDGRIHCIEAVSGKSLWTYFTDGPVRLAPTVSGGRVYAGSDDGCVYCLDAKSGELVWKRRAGPRDERLLARGRMTSRWPVRTGVLVDGGVAYFGAGVFPADTVYLYAVDAATGKVLWKNDWLSERDANRNDLSPQGYLLATEKTLFVPSGRTLPAAIDRAAGRGLFKPHPGWRTDAGGPIGGSEAMLAGGQLYAVGEHHILALDESRGRTGFGWFLATRMTMNQKTAFMANGEEILAVDHEKRAAASRKRHALELKRSDVIHQLATHTAPKLLAEAKRREKTMKTARERANKLKATGKSGTSEYATAVKAAEKTTATYQEMARKYESVRGEFNKLQKTRKSLTAQIEELKKSAIRWSFPSKAESALILAGKTLVAGGEGEVLVLDAESGRLLWKHAVDGEARGLAVSDGRLVVSTTKGSVICSAKLPKPPEGGTTNGGAPETGTLLDANVRSPAFRRKGEVSGSVDEGELLSRNPSNSSSSRLPKPPEGGTTNKGAPGAETQSDDETIYQKKAEAILAASGVRRGSRRGAKDLSPPGFTEPA